MSFTQRGGLFTHMTVHSDHRPHKCDVCGLGWEQTDNFQGGNWIITNYCQFTRFKRKRTMQDHRKTHTDELEYKCTQCEKAFRKKISLRRHLEYHSGEIVKPFICDFCGKGFRLNANLVVCALSYCSLLSWDIIDFLPSLTHRSIEEFTLVKSHTFANIVHRISAQCPASTVIWRRSTVGANAANQCMPTLIF